ncbi:MAG: hypothetical protein NZ937_02740 [Armatimonadetes bacterium]|nr:hypothetical protein [Armatimonadota bacterium]
MASFCRHCGNAIGDGVEKCTHCGASLNSQNASKVNGSLHNEPANKLPQVSPEDLLAQAMKLANEEAYDDAILFCKRAINLKSDFVAAYAFLGELYERVGERDKALSAYNKALEIDKDYEPAKLGKERLEKGLPKPSPPSSAKPLPSEKSDWIWAGHPLPLLGAAALVVSSLFVVRAIVPPIPKVPPVQQQTPITLAPSPQLPNAPQTVPPMPAALELALRRGMDALNSQKYDEAIRWFERANQIAPNNNEARSWLLIARAMKEESQEQRRQPTVAVHSETTPLPVLPVPTRRQTFQPERSQIGSTSSPSVQSESQSQQFSHQSHDATKWSWQQRSLSYPTMPQSIPPPAFIIPSQPQRPNSPNVSQSQSTPSVSPSASSVPSISSPQPTVEDMERLAAQRIYESDFESAVQIYRNILSQGIGIEREGYIRQQLALALQQLRRYDEAAEEYANAIAAYKRQIEQGINVSSAKRGIEACQRGLEICKRAR